jgi:hypothetical protein
MTTKKKPTPAKMGLAQYITASPRTRYDKPYLLSSGAREDALAQVGHSNDDYEDGPQKVGLYKLVAVVEMEVKREMHVKEVEE